MKKSLFVLLMVALALPMMAQYATKAEAMGAMTRNKVISGVPMKSMSFDQRPSMVMRDAIVAWTFENEEDFEGWMALDYDDDGETWFISDNGHNSSTSLASASYITGTGALDPDNWLISPMVALDGLLKFWGVNESSYFADTFDVLVCIGEPNTVDDFVVVAEGVTPPTTWTEYTVDMSGFAGAEGCFAFRHHDSYNMWCVYIDDISLEPLPLAMPVNVTADPAATTADVAWEDAEATGWNLRYRVYTPMTGYYWDFEDDTELPWTSVDADGDGYEWSLWDPESLGYGTGEEGERMFGKKCATSASYQSVALTPDNWMISPLVTLSGEFSFWAGGQDPSYAAEVFGVYVSTDMENWTPLAENVVTGSPLAEYVYDLSAYEGQEGYVAIRHYNVTDMFRLNVDNIRIGTPTPEADWIYVNDLTDPNYTIEGLDPETTYEVQVMGYNDEQETEWTESVLFTTLPGDVPPVIYDETCAAPNGEYIIIDKEKALVTITNNEPGATVHYVVTLDGVVMEEGDFTGDTWEYIAVGPGAWMVSCVASLPGKNDSNPGGVFFPIAPGQQPVAVDEMMAGKTISSVRYYNAAGQEMQEANGLTIVVTTFTDGTTNATKVVK